MQSTFLIEKDYKVIRRCLAFMMGGLVLAGLSAIPVEWGLGKLTRFFPLDTEAGKWFDRVYMAVRETGANHPFLFYGYDWLAFAHFMLAILFIGPYRDPVKNKWVLQFGIGACILLIPFALVAGHYRGIPTWWRLADCAFALAALVPLLISYKRIQHLETLTLKNLAS